MQEKLFDSEAKVMEILWEKGPLSAKEISLIASDSIGWNKNTTYTVIKKLEAKGFIRRDEPGFMCTPLVSREEIQKNDQSHKGCDDTHIEKPVTDLPYHMLTFCR